MKNINIFIRSVNIYLIKKKGYFMRFTIKIHSSTHDLSISIVFSKNVS